ncbi:tRNA (32-2'-O)-methyltransferase regulator Trm732p [Trichomonascus vanleenenianus]|uniref:tRNA methylation protein TRM732 n=1 Tax=Trichomonascus vanleenenianus TaxID=2268995 RepID=UPI003EC98905
MVLLDESEVKTIRAKLVAVKPKDLELEWFLGLFENLYESVLDSPNDGPYRTTACDAMSTWLQRANQTCTLPREDCIVSLKQLITVEVANRVFQYVIDFWNDAQAALGNSLKELLTKTLALASKLWSEDQFNVFIKQWLDRVLHTFARNKRVFYFTFETLTKYYGGKGVIELEDGLLDDLLSRIGSNALANAVSRAVSVVVTTIRRSEPDMALEVWADYWSEPVKKALFNEETRSHTQTYLLPILFKFQPKVVQIFLSRFGQHPDDEDIKIVVGVYKAGQTIGIEVDQSLSEDAFKRLLRHQQNDLRVGGLSLLVSSAKLTKPIPPSTYSLIESSFDSLFISSDSGYRSQVFGLMRQLTQRLRASTHSISRKLEKPDPAKDQAELQILMDKAKDFLGALLHYLDRCLLPGATYPWLIISCQLFTMLVQSGLDDRVSSQYHEKQHISYPFSMDLFPASRVRLLVDQMTNPYEDIRSYATKILKMAPKPLPMLTQRENVDQLASRGFTLISGMRGREGDGGARVMQLVFDLYRPYDVDFLSQIMARLDEGIQLAQRDLLQAVSQHSLHGFFTSLRLIFENTDDWGFLNGTKTVSDILGYCLSTWDLVKDILCHDSPEGNLPEDLDLVALPELEHKFGPLTQVVSSYSWRAVKESASMLRVLITTLPGNLLEDSQLIAVGDLLLQQLSSVRHKGVFSSVYPAFIACCKQCSSRSGLIKQPEKWLNENIEKIQKQAQYVTRRSGGLPHLLTAILIADPNPEKPLLKKTFEKLLAIAYLPAETSGQDKVSLPQVHAFNCIKAVFIESALSSYSLAYIDKALELAIQSFGHEVWAIRNCAVMLFTALQNRLFGPKSMSARLFFSKYRAIQPVLLSHLENHVKNLGSDYIVYRNQAETVYPVLTVLTKLEGVNGYDGLNDFIPLVTKCLKSRVWKIREMAARTLGCLVPSEQVHTIAENLLCGASLRDQNDLHGRSLALLELSKRNIEVPQNFKLLLDSSFEMFILNNPSPETQYAFIRVLAAFHPDSEHLAVMELPPLPAQLSSSARLFRAEVAKIKLRTAVATDKASLQSLLSELLDVSECYEVQLCALEFVDENDLVSENAGKLVSESWELFEKLHWDLVRVPAMKLFARICQERDFADTSLNIESHWNKLYCQVDGRDWGEIIPPCLEALGALTGHISRLNNYVKYKQCYDVLRPRANDGKPFEYRMAVLRSLTAMMDGAKKQQDVETVANNFFEIWMLYMFLSDDDEEIRSAAASFTSRYLEISPCAEAAAETALINHWHALDEARMSEYAFQQFRRDDDGTGADLSLKDQLEKALHKDEALFNVEKPNLYRFELNRIDVLASAVSKFKELDVVKQLPDVITLIERQGRDGLLGWTSDPDVFKLLYKIKTVADRSGKPMPSTLSVLEYHPFLVSK